MRELVNELVKGLRFIEGEIDLDSLFNREGFKAESFVSREFSQWIPDPAGYLYLTLTEALTTYGIQVREGKIADVASSEALAQIIESICDYWESLPYRYAVFFPMLTLQPLGRSRVDIAPGVALVDTEGDGPLENGVVITANALAAQSGRMAVAPNTRYLRVECAGLIRLGTTYEPAVADAIRTAKRFLTLARVERCIRRKSAIGITQPPSTASHIELSGRPATRALALPAPFASTLSNRAFPAGIFRVPKQEDSILGPGHEEYVMQGHERAKRIATKLQRVGRVMTAAEELDQHKQGGEKKPAKTPAHRLSEHCARIVTAAEWLFDAESEHASAVAYVQLSIAFEALYGGTNKDPVGFTLANRCAYSLGDSVEERADLLTKFEPFYTTRSEIVHSGATRLTPTERNQFTWARSTLWEGLRREITLLPPLPGETSDFFTVEP